jgi:hypothetical protein
VVAEARVRAGIRVLLGTGQWLALVECNAPGARVIVVDARG